MFQKILRSIRFRTEKFRRQLTKNEITDLQFISRKLNINIETVYDVGANIGDTVRVFHRLFPAAAIHAFEPNPTVFNNLKTRCKHIKSIVLNNVGVGDIDGNLTLNRHKNSGATSFKDPNTETNPLYNSKIIDKIDVPVITLESYFENSKQHSIDLLKIDVEGFEMEVLKGISSVILENKVKIIFIEANLVEKMLGQGLIENIIDFLRQKNFTLYNIYTQQETKLRQLNIANLIFINNSHLNY